MQPKLFYRVCHIESSQGLWYDQSGKFTGSIHNEFSFCSNANLPMDFDPELVGWLSVTDDFALLLNWFTKDDITKLQNYGYVIAVYEATNYRFYERWQHPVIEQSSSKLLFTMKIL